MSAKWVAAGVRGRALAGRRLGREGARQLAASASVTEAVDTLIRTPYGHEVRLGMDLSTAQHAVTATLAWHLRVLAGWGPAVELGGMRVLATVLEIANVTSHLLGLVGRPADPPVRLGALSSAWSQVSRARTPEQVRQALAASAWGDPGGGDPASIRLALELAWARRVVEGAPQALRWATAFAALVIGRALGVGALPSLGPVQRRDARRVLGHRWEGAASLADLAGRIPRSAAWVFEGTEDNPHDLWRAETRWWTTVETDGSHLLRRSRPGEASTVGVFGVLAADAWRVRAALEIAARGAGSSSEALDALG